MGSQYNKIQKRNRRSAYLKRKKVAAKLKKPATKTTAKTTAKAAA